MIIVFLDDTRIINLNEFNKFNKFNNIIIKKINNKK
jgi:calcineurin-like phosphoesterase family protein